jgi:hypothetical protein
LAEDLFSYVADQLEQNTPLDRLESRGTLRIVLKESGLDPKTVTQKQFCVILESVAPGELDSRGVAEARAICVAIIEKIQGESADRWEASTDVDKIFDRLAGT